MSDNQLQTFKAGAKQPTGMRQQRKPNAAGGAADAAGDTPTLGFARIEAILDHEQPKEVQQRLGGVADALDKIAASAAPAKDKANAKKAKVAISRTAELLGYLFQTKEQMLEAYMAASQNDKGKGKGAAPQGKPNKGGR